MSNESNLFDTARDTYHRISEAIQKRRDEERARQKREAEQRIAAETAEIKSQIAWSVEMWPEYARNQTYSFGVCTVECPSFHHGVVKFEDLPYSIMILGELTRYGVPRENIFLDNYNSNRCSYCVMVNFAKSE